jgi:hypothetical protein
MFRQVLARPASSTRMVHTFQARCVKNPFPYRNITYYKGFSQSGEVSMTLTKACIAQKTDDVSGLMKSEAAETLENYLES